jgi:peptidyl-prolyl cis-trans isomerase SurA
MIRLPKSSATRVSATLLFGSMLAIGIGATGAQAQSIAAVVNSTPITSTQVAERSAFTRLTQKKNPAQRVIVDELIDETLIMQEARKRKITISDSDVDARYATVAQSVKLSPQQLSQALGQAGASERTFKDNIRYQLAYRRLVSGSVNVSNKISEKDIAAGITARRTEGQKIYRYTIRQIVFSMPKDASAGQVAQRQREAQAFRGKLQGCDGAIAAAKGMRDVAVREPVFRTTNQVGPDLDKKLSSIRVGQATEPSRIDLGVEILALCDRQETRDDTGLRQQVQSELANEKLKEESKTYLQGLRRQAAIRYN